MLSFISHHLIASNHQCGSRKLLLGGRRHRGQLTLNTSAGTQTFDFAVGSISSGVAPLGHIFSRQNTSATNGAAISGVFDKQDTSAKHRFGHVCCGVQRAGDLNRWKTPPFLYMVDTNHGFLIGTNGGRVETSVGEPQAAPPFTVISSGRAFCTESPAVSASRIFGGVETVTAGIPHSITTIMQDRNAIAGGLRENVPLPDDTFTIDTTGRITFGSGTKVGYFINSTRSVEIDVQSTDTTPTISISDNQ